MKQTDRTEFDAQLDKILSDAETLIPKDQVSDCPVLPDMEDVHGWCRYELDLWDKGESIRQLILECRKKPNPEQVKRICDICTNPLAGRGRQSFILLLGKRYCAQYAPVIAPFLSDGDIKGHVADTLYKMGTPDYISQMQPLTDDKQTWIRNIARKYIQKYM